jgi:hypothetical protein
MDTMEQQESEDPLHAETQKLIDELQREADLMVEWTEQGIDRYDLRRVPHRFRIAELSEKIQQNLFKLMAREAEKKREKE